MEVKVGECSCTRHKGRSRYPKNEVPIELFQKGNTILKTCRDCRDYQSKTMKVYVVRRRESFQKSVQSGSDLLFCSAGSHVNIGSIYPKKEVPIDLFRKEPGNVKSELFTSCKDCRDHLAIYEKIRIDKIKITAQENNKFYCVNCSKHYEMSDRALNKDDTPSVKCINCKSDEKLIRKKLNNISIMIKMEFIEKYEFSCYLCKSLYIKDKINHSAIELKTYIDNDIRYVNFNDKQYEIIDFIKSTEVELELNILEFDHLTEEEQRDRGLLLSHEEYIPKKYIVSNAKSESAMRLESLKCQLLCAKCHVIETMRRKRNERREGCEDEISLYSSSIRKKLDYTDKLKLQGCEICKYKNSDLPRFFDFDHLDPTTKITNICKMVQESKYTFDELITELSKCRILCHHCHVIHTRIQMDAGIVTNIKRIVDVSYG